MFVMCKTCYRAYDRTEAKKRYPNTSSQCVPCTKRRLTSAGALRNGPAYQVRGTVSGKS